jgi:serine/threonine protein kinase/tetratricopeptide (TPR) repeat protein
MVRANEPLSGRRLSHYLLERRLGTGGMGEVYLAHDLALGRPAAVKLLRPDLAADLPAHIRREARIFARLQHPWIATFYEAGEADGLAFLAMEYVDGETLRERLRRGALPLDHALTLVSCLLEALSHAHAAGILHRDIKPENVMVVGETCAKLLDFGIALRWSDPAADAPAARTATRWTEEDTAAGTHGYAAPEQLRGESVDARTDLFAVGALLYEAIAGRPAFPGATATERIARVLEGNLSPLRGQGLPLELEDVARRALATDPAERFPTSAAFLSAVRRLRSEDNASALPDTIAVLDLANITGDPADNWISSGVAESVAADLARLPGLRVVPRERTLRARAAATTPGRDPDALDVGHVLGCRWTLSGGVQRIGSMLRITASLTEVPTGRVIGAEKIDGPVESIFDIQDRLAQVVASRLNLTAPSGLTTDAGAASLAAYELYAQGKRLADRLEKGTFDQAADLFEEAIRLDPRHAPALSGLAKVHAMRFTYTTNPEELEAAAGFARRAIEADARTGEPHAWLSYALLRSGDPGAAFDAARRAIELDPTLAYGTYFAACAATVARRLEESIVWFRKTVELDSNHGFAWLGLGWGHLSLDHREEAIWCLERMVSLETTGSAGPTAGAGGFLGDCLRRYGLLDAARRACLQGLAAADASDHMYRDTFRGVCLVALGRTAVESGDLESARAAFTQAALHLRGRPRALGGGHLLVQALAGSARVERDPAVLDEAISLARSRRGFDFSWLWCCSDDITLPEIAHACRAVGRGEAAAEWDERACRARVAEGDDEVGFRAGSDGPRG